MIVALAIAVAALALRLAVAESLPLIDADGVVYVMIARQFQESGSPFHPLFHPLYPICISLVQPLVGDWETAGRLVSAVFGSLVILPAFALARAVVGRQAAILAVTLIAAHPLLVRSSTAVLCEATYTFLLVTGVLAARRALTAGPGVLLTLAGVLFGLAYLVRPEGAGYLVAMIAVAIFLIARGHRRAGELLPWLGGAVVAFVGLAAPYVWYLTDSLGRLTISGKIGHNLNLSLGVATEPSPMPVRVVENAFLFEKYGLPELLPGLLMLLVLPGVLARAKTPGWLARDGVLLAAALPPFASLAFHVESRIFLPILPFILPFVAVGVLWSVVTVLDARRAWGWSVLVVVVLVLGLIPWALRPIVRPDAGAARYREAARWIADTQPRDTVLLDRNPFIGFYSQRRHEPLPRVGPNELVAAARHAGARLVVLDSRELLFDRPRLLPLLWGPPPPGLDVLRDFDAAPSDRLRILAVTASE
jgi:4-amino-4-deoxy-L-arabinose transferase-like glycosyltransferase